MQLNFYTLTVLYLGAFAVIIAIAWFVAKRYDNQLANRKRHSPCCHRSKGESSSR